MSQLGLQRCGMKVVLVVHHTTYAAVERDPFSNTQQGTTTSRACFSHMDATVYQATMVSSQICACPGVSTSGMCAGCSTAAENHSTTKQVTLPISPTSILQCVD